MLHPKLVASSDVTLPEVLDEDRVGEAADHTLRFLRTDDRSYTGKGEIENRPHGFSKSFHKGPNNLQPNILRLTSKCVVVYGQGLQHFINELDGDDQGFGLNTDELQEICSDVFDDMVTKFNMELMDNGLGNVSVSLADLTRQVTHPAGRGRWNNRFAKGTLQNLKRLHLWDYTSDPNTQRYTIAPGPMLYAFYDHVYDPLVSEMLTELGLS
ncbi:MAG: hypothetical protein AAF801_00100 [Pseudomonadota bacterium]